MGPINNIPALVQIMAWRRPGDKPLSEPMMVRLLTHICVTWPQWVISAPSPAGLKHVKSVSWISIDEKHWVCCLLSTKPVSKPKNIEWQLSFNMFLVWILAWCSIDNEFLLLGENLWWTLFHVVLSMTLVIYKTTWNKVHHKFSPTCRNFHFNSLWLSDGTKHLVPEPMLTHYALLTSYGNKDISQHWLR